MTSRIALGTVQFGMAYGIANAGQVSPNEVAQIIATARAAQIDTLDTAILYGSSEIVLGTVGTSGFRVVSKLPALPVDCTDVDDWVRSEGRGCLERLQSRRLAGLLLHRPADLLGRRGAYLYQALLALKDDGLVEKIGYSVQTPEDLGGLFERFSPDIVQLPFNVFDRRMQTSGWIDRLKVAGVEVHARSAFLQGLLLLSTGAIPPKFTAWSNLFARWHTWCADYEISLLDGALGHVLSIDGIDRVVVGVDSNTQLQEILTSSRKAGQLVPNDIQAEAGMLINPSQWGAL